MPAYICTLHSRGRTVWQWPAECVSLLHNMPVPYRSWSSIEHRHEGGKKDEVVDFFAAFQPNWCQLCINIKPRPKLQVGCLPIFQPPILQNIRRDLTITVLALFAWLTSTSRGVCSEVFLFRSPVTQLEGSNFPLRCIAMLLHDVS